MGTTCSTHGSTEQRTQKFNWKRRRERGHLRDSNTKDDNIKVDLKGKRYEDPDWIHLAQDKILWLFNTGIK